MKEKVLIWLQSGQPYEEGVQLFAEYGHNATLLKNFSRKATKQRRAMLAYKLVKLAGLPEKYITASPASLPNIKTQNKPATGSSQKSQNIKKGESHPDVTLSSSKGVEGWKGKIPYKDLPKEIRDLINLRVDIEQEITRLAELRNQVPEKNTAANNKKRKDLSDDILELLGKKNELNIQIEAYEKDKVLPSEQKKEQNEVHDMLKLTKKYNNLKSQRSKYRNKLSGKKEIPEGPKKEAAREKLKEIEQEIEEIEQKLPK